MRSHMIRMPVAPVGGITHDHVGLPHTDHGRDVCRHLAEFGCGEGFGVDRLQRDRTLGTPLHPGVEVTPGLVTFPPGHPEPQVQVIGDAEGCECAGEFALALSSEVGASEVL